MVCELLISWINIFFYSSDLNKLIPIFKCKLWVLNKQKPIQILKKNRELSWVFLQGQSKSYKNFIEQNFPHIMPPKILVLSDEFSSVLYFLQQQSNPSWKEFYNYIYRNCKSFNLYHITPSLKMKAMGYNFFNLRTNPIQTSSVTGISLRGHLRSGHLYMLNIVLICAK